MDTNLRFEAIFSIMVGVFLIIGGLTASHLVNESDVSATEDEWSKARATPLRRGLVVAAGVASILYGLYQLAR